MYYHLLKKKHLCTMALWAMILSANCQPVYAATDTYVNAGPDLLQPVDTTEAPEYGYLGGSRLTLISNQTKSQMLSVMVETDNGQIIMIDGGTSGDADHLYQLIQSKGGYVDTWLVTHPHEDHVGALYQFLTEPEYDISIGHIYGSFAAKAWYLEFEPGRTSYAGMFLDALAALPEDQVDTKLFKGQEIQVDNINITVMNEPYQISRNAINNSSVAYQLDINGKKALFLGDMGKEAGSNLLSLYSSDELKSDIVQMSHHGQQGAGIQLYRAIDPEVCLWPTTDWLWDNDCGDGYDTGKFKTIETRKWMACIGVPYHLCMKDGDQVIE